MLDLEPPSTADRLIACTRVVSACVELIGELPECERVWTADMIASLFNGEDDDDDDS